MAPRRQSSSSHEQHKRHFDTNEPKGRRKAHFDLTVFNSKSLYERNKS